MAKENRKGGGRLLRAVGIAALVVVAGTGAAVWTIAKNWPFTREAVVATLESRFDRDITIDLFRYSYFPPGCVARGVKFLHRRRKMLPPMITAGEIRIVADWAGLMSANKRLARIEIRDLHVTVPLRNPAAIEPAAPAAGTADAGVGITAIDVDGASLDFLPARADRRPYHLDLDSLSLGNVNEDRPVTFVTRIRNTDPPGTITASGSLGPWTAADSGATPVAGSFVFDKAALSAYAGLGGTLTARGTFGGTLRRIGVKGTAGVDGFRAGSGQAVKLEAEFAADVDAANGNTAIERVRAHFLRTTLTAAGAVEAPAGAEGKSVSLQLACPAGRVEDLFRLFSGAGTPAMTGPLTFQARVTLPPGTGFWERVEAAGGFGIDGALFANSQVETPISDLSNSASGQSDRQVKEDPKTVVSDLKGRVDLKGGVANLTEVTFGVPGAEAEMRGAVNIEAQTMDLRGVLHTRGDLSDATSGFKALVLKLATPFLRRKKVTVVPFVIRGPLASPSFSLDFDGKRTL